MAVKETKADDGSVTGAGSIWLREKGSEKLQAARSEARREWPWMLYLPLAAYRRPLPKGVISAQKPSDLR
ncbi:hypothetical protein HW090_10370 [Pseudomonas sp. ABC1]|uniref:hypothetical protein n=1 Tax=Pseudomonas sp. ABC1 TaxID=2748080 RepID=UPI0015C40B1D|nr:hypothetical protein [Pseudomonas sp. ABC1]QLF93574.1 hypothetical protein HW090_10370 [Pseudomonas sp. ABC1]